MSNDKDYTNLPDEEVIAINLLTELKWQRLYFVPLFTQLGWTGYHETDSRTSRVWTPTGTPTAAALDWLLWRDRVIHVELKKKGGSLSEGQRETIRGLSGAKAEVYVWYPRHWWDIVTTLIRGST